MAGIILCAVRRFLAVLGLALLAAPALAAPSAPGFTLRLLDGRMFVSRSLIGKQTLVVRFQASWCTRCVEEAPAIERLYEKYRASGVEVVAVQVQDTEADARRFLTAHGATYPAGLDPHLTIANRFGVKSTPCTVVINKRGEMVARLRGHTDEARLARVLDPLIQEPVRRRPPSRLQ
jgi:cytochrome c biogenesis protein CcmG, thiol:disulfide interchange protein DsbE